MTAKPCVAGALTVAAVGFALRVLLAPVRWATELTVQTAEEDDGYVWWQEPGDGEPGWARLTVDDNVEVATNGHNGWQHVGRT